MVVPIFLVALAASAEGIDPSRGAFLAVDLDSLEAVARGAYDTGDWEAAAAGYVELLRHDVSNSNAIYNAACSFGLMGEDTLAAVYLTAAVRAGFEDPAFASGDPDFDAVRESAVFSSTLDSLITAATGQDAASGETVHVAAGSLIPVRVVLPADYCPGAMLPLVVGLHGYGSNAEDFLGLYGRMESHELIFAIPETPYAMSSGRETGYSWSTWSESDSTVYEASLDLSSELVRNVVLELQARYAPSSTCLLGFSQGCALAYLAGFSSPDVIDGIIGFGGYVEDPAPFLEAPPEARELRIFVAHGTDDRIVDISESRRAYSLFDSLGCNAVMVEFDGAHTIHVRTLEEALEWMHDLEGGIRGD
jgi:phospholipase/carboxylesterase